MPDTSFQGPDRSQGEVPALIEGMQTSAESSVQERTTTTTTTMRAMSSRRRYGVIVWLLALGLGVLGACAAKQSAGSRSPEAAAAWQSDASVEDLERALDDEEQRLRAAGIALPASLVASSPPVPVKVDAADGGGGESVAEDPSVAPLPAEASPEPSLDVTVVQTESVDIESSRTSRRRCNDVCDLAASICDLEQHICSLAIRHAGEARYTAVCERASGDCDAAQEACNVCE